MRAIPLDVPNGFVISQATWQQQGRREILLFFPNFTLT